MPEECKHDVKYRINFSADRARAREFPKHLVICNNLTDLKWWQLKIWAHSQSSIKYS